MENKKMACSNNELLKGILERLDSMNSTITSLQNDVINIKKAVIDKDISFVEYEEQPERHPVFEPKKESTKGWFFN
jgi:hypothetical protein